jgi:hypothetical protein
MYHPDHPSGLAELAIEKLGRSPLRTTSRLTLAELRLGKIKTPDVNGSKLFCMLSADGYLLLSTPTQRSLSDGLRAETSSLQIDPLSAVSDERSGPSDQEQFNEAQQDSSGSQGKYALDLRTERFFVSRVLDAYKFELEKRPKQTEHWFIAAVSRKTMRNR